MMPLRVLMLYTASPLTSSEVAILCVWLLVLPVTIWLNIWSIVRALRKATSKKIVWICLVLNCAWLVYILWLANYNQERLGMNVNGGFKVLKFTAVALLLIVIDARLLMQSRRQ